MNEAARLLRLVAPGSLFLLLYGVWFLIDADLCDRSPPGLGVAGGALAAGATIPIGFIAQVLAGEITWLPGLRERRWRPFSTIDNHRVSELIRGRQENRSKQELVGIVDIWIHEAPSGAERTQALSRIRSIADLYQGLAHGAVASALAGLLAVATVFVTARWLGDGGIFGSRVEPLLTLLGVSLVLSILMCLSHRRVVTIAEAMVVELLTPGWRR